MKKQLKIYAFIDSQNLNLGVKDQGWSLDFAKFRVYLKEKYDVEKAFLFIGYIPTNKKLYSYLEKHDYKLIFKPILEIKRAKEIKVKGNVDAELVLHTMIEYQNFNKAIIATGDGDFHCLVEYLVKKNKLKAILIPNRLKFSALLKLRLFKPFLRYINDLENKLGYEKKKPHKDKTLQGNFSVRDYKNNNKKKGKSQ